jgi:hypothetical protein
MGGTVVGRAMLQACRQAIVSECSLLFLCEITNPVACSVQIIAGTKAPITFFLWA